MKIVVHDSNLDTGAYTISCGAAFTKDKNFSFPLAFRCVFPASHQSGITPYFQRNADEVWQVLDERAFCHDGKHGLRFSLPVARCTKVAFLSGSGYVLHPDSFVVERFPYAKQSAVVVTADDWDGQAANHAAFMAAAKACRERELWLTAGVVSQGICNPTLKESGQGIAPQWQAIGAAYAEGYLEIAAHSASHPAKVPYGARLHAEIAESKEEIERQLPQCNVSAWIEPCGYRDTRIARKLAAAHYLVSRGTAPRYAMTARVACNPQHWRIGISRMMEKSNPDDANKAFEASRKAQGVYLAAMHPRFLKWDEDAWILSHLDYISGHDDIWYAGLGQMAAYYRLRHHGVTICQGRRILWQPGNHWLQRYLSKLRFSAQIR